MKYILTFLLLFISLVSFGQQPDLVKLKLKSGEEYQVNIEEIERSRVNIITQSGKKLVVYAFDIESIDGIPYKQFYEEKGEYFNSYEPTSYDEGYKASNGVTYKVGDTIILGRGSAANGDFRYLVIGGFGQALYALDGQTINSESLQIGSGYSGLGIVVKKIKTVQRKGIEKVYFVVGGGNITNYWLFIEDAIATCEVRDCKQPVQNQPVQIINQSDKYDQLKKLKELLDSGIITQEEFDTEKKKLLDKD